MHDWNQLVHMCNSHFNTDLTEKQMIKYIYKKGGSLRRAADLMGIHYQSFTRRLEMHKIKKLPPGGHRKSVAEGIDFKGKTVNEIAKLARCSKGAVYDFANKHELKYKQAKRGRKRIKHYD